MNAPDPLGFAADVDHDDDVDDDDDVEHVWESREVRWSALAGFLLVVGFVAGRFDAPDIAVTGLYVASTVAGLRFFALEAVTELVRERVIGIELLMTVGTLAAGGLGEWGEAATLAFLYSISEALEEFTEDRTRNAIRALMDLAPKRVNRLRDGVEEEIDLDALAVGDRFVVHMDRESLNDYPLGRYDVTVVIETFEQDRDISWSILGAIEPPIGHTYGYRLEAVEGGTLVTSIYDWSEIDPVWREAAIFPIISEAALRATLGILDRTVRRRAR